LIVSLLNTIGANKKDYFDRCADHQAAVSIRLAATIAMTGIRKWSRKQDADC